MADELVPVNGGPGTALSTEQIAHTAKLDALSEVVERNARSPNTLRMYAWSWSLFLTFCAPRGMEPLPASPDTVRRFLIACSTGLPDDGAIPGTSKLRVRSIGVVKAAIVAAHTGAGFPDPCADPRVVDALKGIRRTFGAPPRKKRAFGMELLRHTVAIIPADDPIGCRDRALLTMWYAGAFRREELLRLRSIDVDIQTAATVTIPRSKNDPYGKGATIPIHRFGNEACPVANLQAWLALSGITGEAPIFQGFCPDRATMRGKALNVQTAARILQRRLVAGGMSPADAARFSGHSPRRGLITDAARAGASITEIQRYSRHKTPGMVAEYIEEATMLREDAVSRMFKAAT